MNRTDSEERFRQLVREELPKHKRYRQFVDGVPEAFADRALRGLDLRSFVQLKPRQVAALMLETLQFMEGRKRGEILVGVDPAPESLNDTGTLLRSSMDDQPFIFDTIRMLADSHRPAIDSVMVHPVVSVRRDADGRIECVGVHGDPLESIVLVHLKDIDSAERMRLAEQVRERLSQSHAVVRDFHTMLGELERVREDLPYVAAALGIGRPLARTSINFLRWLADENFIFLGVSYFDLDQSDSGMPTMREDSRLGLFALDFERSPLSRDYPLVLRGVLDGTKLVSVRKSEVEGTVHRFGKIDLVAIRAQEGEGRNSVLVAAGLFTQKAVSSEASRIPILAEKITQVLDIAEAPINSALSRSMRKAINSIPVEYLFEATITDIGSAMRMILEAEESREVGSHAIYDDMLKAAYVLVTVPRERYNDALREALLHELTTIFHATYHDHRVDLGDSGNVVIQTYLTSAGRLKVVHDSVLNETVRRLSLDWSEQLSDLIALTGDSDEARERATLYRRAFPDEMKLALAPNQALIDVEAAEDVLGTSQLQIRFADNGKEDPIGVSFKLYTNQQIPLSDSVPVLDNFGIRVIDHSSHVLSPKDRPQVCVDAFRVHAGIEGADIASMQPQLTDALRMVFNGNTPNDLLNGLLLAARVTWREVALVRAYVKYGRQIGWFVDREKVYRILLQHKNATGMLLQLFHCRHMPAINEAQRKEQDRSVSEAFLAYLNGVEIAVEDRALRRLFELVQATVRTSFFTKTGADDAIVLKFDCSAIKGIPVPKPYREIYVHHGLVEGVHLRGGPVARGGLRWSDRPDDFRTEVLGLMRTQMVKNVVIVPVGAKGGFVLNRTYASRDEARRAADEVYKIFIRGLLSVTDNVIKGKVVHPPNMVIRDGDDPYLVVAADKGTAHLSDTANSIAQEQQFWLDDAFASGGSYGYDHKKIAITARGAWVCVQRHFYELGVNPEVDPITVVGIGDMSGDVFGNGLLSSRTMRLLAAFNHMNIFIDPNPDAEQSFIERKRLYDLPRSTWEDYKTELISEGGGVFDRNAKQIQLTPQMCAVLGTDNKTMSGDEVVQHILMAEVDLLWNGGIGTYFKASTETDADAMDPSNDVVRINADRIRARVIAEGGNLGMTQAARVEAAIRGVRINTDAIDNSGGVDMSDHEVNLKILFAHLMAAKEITRDERNQVLGRLESQVADMVLANNQSQSMLLSCDTDRSVDELAAFVRLIEDLEDRGLLDAKAEELPSAVELTRRQQAKQGLTRPELAKMAPFVKMEVYQALLKDDNFTGPFVDRALMSYWPNEVRERFSDAISKHQLRKEIAATVLSNRIVDQAGATFFNEATAATGRSITEVAFAYLMAMDLMEAEQLYNDLDALVPNIRSGVHVRIRNEMHTALETTMHWLLSENIDLHNSVATIKRFGKAFRDYRKALPDPLQLADRRDYARKITWHVGRNIGSELSERLTRFQYGTRAGDVAVLAELSGAGVDTAAEVLNQIGTFSQIQTCFKLLRDSDHSDRFERSATELLREELRHLRHKLTLKALAQRRSKREDVRTTISRFRTDNHQELARIVDTARYIQRAHASGIAPAVTLLNRIRRLPV